jgi:hypothetical protein
LSTKAPEFNIKARKGQDLNAVMSQLGVGDKKTAGQKLKPHEFNPRADDPFASELMTAKGNEQPQRYDGWGQPLPGPPETPDPRWRLGRSPSPGLVEAFGKSRKESEGGMSASSKSKRRGLTLAKDKTLTPDLLNLN